MLDAARVSIAQLGQRHFEKVLIALCHDDHGIPRLFARSSSRTIFLA